MPHTRQDLALGRNRLRRLVQAAREEPLSLPPEVETEKRVRSSSNNGKPVRKLLPDDMPREVIRHELTEDRRKCS